MIQHRTYKNSVFILNSKGLKKAVPAKRYPRMKLYEAEDNDILIELYDDVIKVLVGREVKKQDIRNLVSFAISHNKPIEVIDVPLNQLYVIDKAIGLVNQSII